jgi:hypothetical protein
VRADGARFRAGRGSTPPGSRQGTRRENHTRFPR